MAALFLSPRFDRKTHRAACYSSGCGMAIYMCTVPYALDGHVCTCMCFVVVGPPQLQQAFLLVAGATSKVHNLFLSCWAPAAAGRTRVVSFNNVHGDGFPMSSIHKLCGRK